MPTSKQRPGHRDDDQIWLLERIAGLLYSDGKGTDAADLIRGIATSEVHHYVRATHAAASPGTEIPIQLPTTTRSWLLVAVAYHRTSGSGSTISLRLGQSAGFSADGPDDRIQLDTQVAASPLNVVMCEPVPLKSDAAGKIYLRPGYDAGGDNIGTYQLWFRQGVLTPESS